MPHRRSLLALIDSYALDHPEESSTVVRFRTFVSEQPRCFDRELTTGHVTGSAWLTSPDGESVLLTHHRKLDAWLQLGGHADGETDIRAVALREAQEESGIDAISTSDSAIFDIDIHAIPERINSRGLREPGHLHYDVRFCLVVAPGHGPAVVSEESKALRWVDVSQIDGLPVDASVRRMAAKWRRRRQSRA